jgi:hypothetical protein
MISLEDKPFNKKIILPKECIFGEFSLKKIRENSGYKVNIQLLNDNELISYLAFKVGDNFIRADFSGMIVKPAFRRKGISKQMFEIFQSVANQNSLSTDITKNQKKPIVCKILQSFGYAPKGKSIEQLVEIIGNKLFFQHEGIKNKYLNSSNHAKQTELEVFLISEKEKILGIINPENIERIYLNTKYKKIKFPRN